jgi:chromosome segregation protein
VLFGGGSVKLVAIKKEKPAEDEFANSGTTCLEPAEGEDDIVGLDVAISVPSKGIKGVEMLSGGEKSLVSIAVLFALISLTPPPFLVLDEVDAALDEHNARRFAKLIKEFGNNTQFIVVTHNRATMEAADVLYGVTMDNDGISKLLSVKFSE